MRVLAEQDVRDAPLEALPEVIRELGGQRLLLVTGPSRRWVERATSCLAEFRVELFDEARRHVPRDVVRRATERLAASGANAIVTLGGGSATGLGKALRLEHALPFVAIPTTYSGSEYTTLYGTTQDGQKLTGRDPRVRPDVVLRDPSLTQQMPLTLTVTSLLNAMAHPVARLANDELAEEERRRAQQAVKKLLQAVETLLVAPTSRFARGLAFEASGLAAAAIEAGALGEHHRLAHLLGGAFDLDHSQLHSILLPHSLSAFRREHRTRARELAAVLDECDLEASIFDLLARSGGATSLSRLGLSLDRFSPLVERQAPEARALLFDAFYGRRPSATTRREDWGAREAVRLKGPELKRARRVVLCLHGRGSNADVMLKRAEQLLGDDPEVVLLAPQAPGNSWYKKRYDRPLAELGAELHTSLSELKFVAKRLLTEVEPSKFVIFGFSQGACLALELFVALGLKLAGVVALSGARIGAMGEGPPAGSALAGTRVLLGKSESDPWLDRARLEATAAELHAAGCAVTLETVAGDGHGFHAMHRVLARPILCGRESWGSGGGFGAFHETEDLPGALPRRQNSPQPAKYGLTAEQVNATGFCVQRSHNERSWLYRVRPSAQQGVLLKYPHPSCSSDFAERPAEPNLVGFRPLPLPQEPTDFVDGLATIAGSGLPAQRRGYAIHTYAANRNMEERAFSSSDGSLLLIPELGALNLLTELGVLYLRPGQVALIPRGLRFSVLLREQQARGYLAEVFGAGFRLPERGPIGANGLTEARHFEAPHAWHEDRLSVGFELMIKTNGSLYRAAQDYSPFDVVAWHGNYSPYVYDLMNFSPVSNVRFDHVDPSVYTVLSAPLDEPGSNTLDFVVFVPRWDPTEGTFRPPYFHRNATTEFNGIIQHSGQSSMFEAGGCFVTPSMLPHGIASASLPPSAAEAATEPSAPAVGSLWFQFESSLPCSLTSWAARAAHRIGDWRAYWGGYRSSFRSAL